RNISFQASVQPKASVVLPVYNNFRKTMECLYSLRQRKNSTPFEIIVVDDGSSDSIPELVPSIVGVKYVKNEANSGFIKAMNTAAQHSTSQYLVFLSSEAQVTDCWLDRLIETLEANPEVGAAGPKILCPNGRLVEAGRLVNSDATATVIGAGDDPGSPT